MARPERPGSNSLMAVVRGCPAGIEPKPKPMPCWSCARPGAVAGARGKARSKKIPTCRRRFPTNYQANLRLRAVNQLPFNGSRPGLSDNVRHEGAMMFRASIETASAISGVSIEELNWLKSTRPIFTVLAGDQAIPYFEFGPGIQEELPTSSGFTVRALEDAVELIDWAGQVSRYELPAADDFNTMKSKAALSESGDSATEVWWYLITVGGGLGCAALTELCNQRCVSRMADCGECGGQCDCDWCGRSSWTCFTCLPTLPRDSGWFNWP